MYKLVYAECEYDDVSWFDESYSDEDIRVINRFLEDVEKHGGKNRIYSVSILEYDENNPEDREELIETGIL